MFLVYNLTMYKTRRASFNQFIIIKAHDLIQKVNDTPYPFIQESYFLWLTGISAPDWRLIIDGKNNVSYLVEPYMSDAARLFDGATNADDIKKVSGIDAVINFDEAQALIEKLSNEHDIVYSVGPDPQRDRYDFVLNNGPVALWNELQGQFKVVKDIRPILAKKRAIKSDDEIVSMKHAIDVSIKGFNSLKPALEDQNYEYQLEAQLSHAFRYAGAQGHAYEPIVASGLNACTLHYIKNNDALPENGLVLIDAGARVNGYCADITRTYAIGTPTERQVAVHAAVEKAHHAIIALLGPGKSVKEYHEQVDVIMIQALTSLGLYKKPSDYRKYFPHAISHGLGIDVHDSLGGPTHFKAGMVLTVEPGIYIPEEEIGVRIEDDILITATGYENLSGSLSTSL